MKSRFRQAFFHRVILIQDMPQILYCRRDDATPARGADDIVERAIFKVFDDGRGDGRQRSLTRFDEIGGRGLVAESIGLVGD